MNRLHRSIPPHARPAVAGLSLLFLAGCGHAPATTSAAPADHSVVVEAVDAVSRTVPLTIDAVGHMDAVAAVAITPLVNSRIEAVLVKDGADVQAGQPLVRFDPRTYAAQLDRMKGERDARSVQVAALQSRQDRSAGLIAGDFLSPQQAQEQEVDLAQAKAALAAANAGVASAAVDLENCQPKAPFAGRVGLLKSSATVGAFTAAGSDPLMEIRDLRHLKVEFSVPQSALTLLLQQASAGHNPDVIVSPADDPSTTVKGEVGAFDNVIDPHNLTLKVRAVVDNADLHFWPGEFVKVKMIVGTATDAVLVPFEAINTGPNGSYVYVVQGGKAAVKPVALGQTVDNLVIVKSGVNAGDRVILSGALGLQDGSSVKVSSATTASL
ncbi:MAG TPA: efflux RND transporter periplasmic adaptor subunit [Opitutaceae bacterium]